MGQFFLKLILELFFFVSIPSLEIVLLKYSASSLISFDFVNLKSCSYFFLENESL